MRVETFPIDDPGALVRFLDPSRPLAFLRNGDGIVGLGESRRLEFSGAARVTDAAAAWRALCANADVVDPVRLPGTGLVALGSFAFADDSAAPSVLVVPSVIVGRRNGRGWVTVVDGAERPTPVAPGWPVAAVFRAGAMAPDVFESAVTAAVERIAAGDLSKVVLARDLVGDIPAGSDLRHPISRLAGAYPDTFTFAVEGLLGSSPETLVRTLDGSVTARVLAGSAARGADAAADALVGEAIAASAKDLAEHDFALRSVLTALEAHTEQLTATERPYALRLPNLWHLASDVSGRLADGASALDLVAALHPTAAVAGTPTDAALRLIAELELSDRGRYAGPVGWIDASGDGEWAIALRCAQVDGTTVRAWAGAGIVADSDPARELAETELKFAPVLDAFRR